MKALYTTGVEVPTARVLREHRAALLPLGIVLAINLIALVAIVLPMSQRAGGLAERATVAEQTRAAAAADVKRAELLRASSSRATEDLERFYADVLPANVAAARRILLLKLRQQADTHNVTYRGSGTREEVLRNSNLLRLAMSMRLGGSYEDLRAFIYDLETSPDFVVIEQVRLSEASRAEGLELSLDVATYYRTAAANAGAAPDARVATDGR